MELPSFACQTGRVPQPDIEPPNRTERPKRRGDDGYRLHVESITYLGDDVAAARAIENFLRLRRSRDRQQAEELKPDERVDGGGLS